MTFPFLGNNCTGLTACVGFRGLVCYCLANNNDGKNANMIAWMNAYDLSQVPWGILRSFFFRDVGDATPDPTSEQNSLSPGVDDFSQVFLIDGDGNPFPTVTAQRAQVWWPGNSTYGVIAVDAWNPYQTGYLCCTGQTTACASIFELPIPNGDFPSDIPANRIRYTAHLGLTPDNITDYYVGQLAFNVPPNYGSHWDPAQTCQPSPVDPFFGEAP